MQYPIPDNEITWRFIRAQGPGGQNVNKVASAVQLHFNVTASTVLSPDAKQRLFDIAGNRINKEGELVISAQRFRRQQANREDALKRLYKFLHRAETKPKKRIKTKMPKAVKQKNKLTKQKQSLKKLQRGKVRSFD